MRDERVAKVVARYILGARQTRESDATNDE